MMTSFDIDIHTTPINPTQTQETHAARVLPNNLAIVMPIDATSETAIYSLSLQEILHGLHEGNHEYLDNLNKYINELNTLDENDRKRADDSYNILMNVVSLRLDIGIDQNDIINIIQKLIHLGVDVNKIDQHGNSPLNLAMERGPEFREVFAYLNGLPRRENSIAPTMPSSIDPSTHYDIEQNTPPEPQIITINGKRYDFRSRR